MTAYNTIFIPFSNKKIANVINPKFLGTPFLRRKTMAAELPAAPPRIKETSCKEDKSNAKTSEYKAENTK